MSVDGNSLCQVWLTIQQGGRPFPHLETLVELSELTFSVIGFTESLGFRVRDQKSSKDV